VVDATEQDVDPDVYGDDDDDDDDEDVLSPRDINTFLRAAAALRVSSDALEDEGGEMLFGPASFGLVALGSMLEIVKKATKLMYDQV
jgi:hypothetical protein